MVVMFYQFQGYYLEYQYMGITSIDRTVIPEPREDRGPQEL
jgi:hypothetical protein